MTQIIALVHRTLPSARLPVIRLTGWGDLKTLLAAVEAGVNDMVPRHASWLRYVSIVSFM
jgi:hypothetical protein